MPSSPWCRFANGKRTYNADYDEFPPVPVGGP